MSNEAVIEQLNRIIEQLDFVQVPIAKDILRTTVAAIPRPAFDTGALRRSGRAYVNGRFVSSTHRMREAQGSNLVTDGWKRKGLVDDNETISSSVGGIEIIYKASYAKRMHDHHGKFTDSESGPGFVSSKMTLYRNIIEQHLDSILK